MICFLNFKLTITISFRFFIFKKYSLLLIIYNILFFSFLKIHFIISVMPLHLVIKVYMVWVRSGCRIFFWPNPKVQVGWMGNPTQPETFHNPTQPETFHNPTQPETFHNPTLYFRVGLSIFLNNYWDTILQKKKNIKIPNKYKLIYNYWPK